jgi:Tol biopolymer transport system component
MRKIPSLLVVGALGAGLILPASPASAALPPYIAVQRLSVTAATPDGASTEPSLSGNNQWVVFTSDATNLVAADTNASSDVFVRNQATGAITRVSLDLDGSEASADSFSASISNDGRYVAFLSDHELVPEDENGSTDAYVRDRDVDADGVFDEPGAGSTTTRVSSENGLEVENAVTGVRLNGAGTWVAVVTDFGFVAADQNESDDVYVREIVGDETMRRISRGSTNDGGGGDLVTISDNGRYVGFRTFSFDVAPGNVSGYYVRDRDADNDGVFDESGTAQKVTVMSNPVPNANVARFVSYAGMSADGRFVSFTGNGTDLVAGAVNNSLYLRDRDTDTDGVMDEDGAVSLEIISKSTGGFIASGQRPMFSPNSRYVLFESAFPGLVPADESGIDVLVRDRTLNTTMRMTVRPSGLGSNGSATAGGIDDAGAVVFASTGTNLTSDDTSSMSDIFRSFVTSAPAFTYTVRTTEADYALALQAAAYYGTTVDALAQRGTWTLAWIVAISGGNPGAAVPQPNDGAVVMHTTYPAAQNGITTYVAGEFDLTGDAMHALGLRFMIFVWMLETA